MRILYIEDEPADAVLVERYAKLMHYDLTIVSNFEDIQAVLEPPPDLILVDIIIRETRAGYKFAQDLRESGYTQPLIALTGLAMPQDIERCYTAGFTDVLTKPYDIHRLVELLQKYGVEPQSNP